MSGFRIGAAERAAGGSDIIMVGEMRDYETIMAALTAAETGTSYYHAPHHRRGADDRPCDRCLSVQQSEIRCVRSWQLAGVLKGVITQCLMPSVNGGGRFAATEICWARMRLGI